MASMARPTLLFVLSLLPPAACAPAPSAPPAASDTEPATPSVPLPDPVATAPGTPSPASAKVAPPFTGRAAAPASGRASGPAPDLSDAGLIILSVDTLRADATEMLGGPAGITPAMAEFASHGVLFTHARAQAPQTAPSHMSLFTSTYPSVHGVENAATDDIEGVGETLVALPLPADIPTLAEVLTAAGFTCLARTEAGNLLPDHGFDRGFREYRHGLVGAQQQVDRGIADLAELAESAGRHFYFWHTYACHAPYAPPAPFIERWAPQGYDGPLKARIVQLSHADERERFAAMQAGFAELEGQIGEAERLYARGLYHGAVSYADSELSRLLAAMEERGVFDRNIVVLLSDHGEAFQEHGHWQHEDCYEECLRVPLVIRLPGEHMAGRRIDVPVALVDVMPTLLHLLQVDTDALDLPGRVRCAGVSLADALLAGATPRPRPIVSEYILTHGGRYDRLVALHANGMKSIFDEVRTEVREGGTRMRRELYDLSADPRETHDLSPSREMLMRQFTRLYVDFSTVQRAAERSASPMPAAQAIAPASALAPDPATDPASDTASDAAEALRQLGYVR
jgi:arylsulfatase A-like enzyme